MDSESGTVAIVKPATSTADLVAFHGPVQLWRWEWHSAADPKLKFRLENRDALEHFEKATTRRGAKSGQRYRVLLADAEGERIPDAPDEAWLYGANWSHQEGAYVALAFQVDALLEFWRHQAEGAKFYLTLVELSDDEEPVNQKKADRLAGGPLAKNAGRLCRDPQFLEYVAYRRVKPDINPLEAADYVRAVCGVKSRALLDHDFQAARAYASLQSDFTRWRNGDSKYP